MPRKLKAYQTSIGFFDLAVAAPSMKAALEAWGSKSNLFHQGFAKEAQDPAIIAATMAKPGVVLRRAVGSSDPFSKNAALPRDLGGETAKTKRAVQEPPEPELDDKAIAAAARAFEKEKNRREREREREAAAREKRRKQRELAIATAETALQEATRIHESKVAEIEDARSALDEKLQAEDVRWQKRRATLEAALSRARQ
jgi:hypothetical protein